VQINETRAGPGYEALENQNGAAISNVNFYYLTTFCTISIQGAHRAESLVIFSCIYH
jgi:hypothetical protein